MSYRISHRDCFHDNTQGARARCRRQQREYDAAFESIGAPKTLPQNDPNEPGRVLEFAPVGIPTFTRTTEDHCENCGTLDLEALMTGDQGYTACCNELVCHGGTYTAVWHWVDDSTGTGGTIESCCAARITFPHDQMHITHRA